jgi:von Willebrand factor type A domain
MDQCQRAMAVWGMLAICLSAAPAYAADNNVVVVLDDSGSMKQQMPNGMLRIDAAKQALTAVLSQLPPKTRVGVLALNTRLNDDPWIVPMGPIGDIAWQGRIAAIEAKGGTLLGQFSKIGADELLKLRAADRYGTYRLLIVTDGEATDPVVLNQFLPDILSRGLTLDVIGVSMAHEHSLANSAHSYRSADDTQSLTAAISEVFAETKADNQSSQDDFEMIQGLPDGIAEEVIKALSVMNNEPIKEAAPVGGGAVLQTPTSPIPPAQMLPSRQPSILGGLVCCFGTLVGLVLVGAILIRSLFGNRR